MLPVGTKIRLYANAKRYWGGEAVIIAQPTGRTLKTCRYLVRRTEDKLTHCSKREILVSPKEFTVV